MTNEYASALSPLRAIYTTSTAHLFTNSPHRRGGASSAHIMSPDGHVPLRPGDSTAEESFAAAQPTPRDVAVRGALRYAAAFVLLGSLDALWIGVLSRYVFGLDYFQVVESIQQQPVAGRPLGFLAYVTMAYAAAFMQNSPIEAARTGFVIYSVVDLTNTSLFHGWTYKVALLDLAWGTTAYTLVGLILSRMPRAWGGSR